MLPSQIVLDAPPCRPRRGASARRGRRARRSSALARASCLPGGARTAAPSAIRRVSCRSKQTNGSPRAMYSIALTARPPPAATCRGRGRRSRGSGEHLGLGQPPGKNTRRRRAPRPRGRARAAPRGTRRRPSSTNPHVVSAQSTNDSLGDVDTRSTRSCRPIFPAHTTSWRRPRRQGRVADGPARPLSTGPLRTTRSDPGSAACGDQPVAQVVVDARRSRRRPSGCGAPSQRMHRRRARPARAVAAAQKLGHQVPLVDARRERRASLSEPAEREVDVRWLAQLQHVDSAREAAAGVRTGAPRRRLTYSRSRAVPAGFRRCGVLQHSTPGRRRGRPSFVVSRIVTTVTR